MNAYLVQEDSESKVWVAETMQTALHDAWTDYLREQLENGSEWDDEEEERLHYEANILQSCSYIAEVGIVRPTPEERELSQGIAEIDNSDDD